MVATAFTGLTPTLARIGAEICERLDEMEELKHASSITFIQRLSRLSILSPYAYRLTVQLFHENNHLLDSFSEQARPRAITKQAVHKEFVTEMETIERVFPELAEQIRTQRDKVNHHEDPISPGEAVEQCVGAVNAFDGRWSGQWPPGK